VIKGLRVFVTLAVLVFDTSELLVCVTEAVVVLDDNELLVYEEVAVIFDEPVTVIEFTGVLDTEDDIDGVGVHPALLVAVVVTVVVAERVRVGLIVLVEVPDTVGVLELLMDEVIVGLPRIVNVSLEVTVMVNRALAVLVPLVEADTVRDTRTLGEFLGLDVTVLVACLDTVNRGEEVPVLLDIIVLVALTLAVVVFEDVDVAVVVLVNLIVLDITAEAVYEADPEEVLDGLIEALEVPLTVEVLDTGAERDPVGEEVELLELLIDAVVVLLTVTVRVDVEEPVLVLVENDEIDICGLLDDDLE
jgi:hypothetical protein